MNPGRPRKITFKIKPETREVTEANEYKEVVIVKKNATRIMTANGKAITPYFFSMSREIPLRNLNVQNI